MAFFQIMLPVLFIWVWHVNAHPQCDLMYNYNMPNCTDAQENKFKFYKSEWSQYIKCPQSKVCFEENSEIYLNTTLVENRLDGRTKTGLCVENMASLMVHSNSSLQISNSNVDCRVATFSVFSVQARGRTKINGGSVRVQDWSSIFNEGQMELAPNSRVRAGTYSSIHFSHRAKAILDRGADVDVTSNAVLELHDERDTAPSQQLVMKEDTTLNVYKVSQLRLVSGTLTLMDTSQVHVRDGGMLRIDGHVLFDVNANVVITGRVDVGRENMNYNLIGNANASLRIFKHLTVTSNQLLVVKKGAHCLAKDYLSVTNGVLTLDSNTKMEGIECFNNRQDLDEAYKNFLDYPPLTTGEAYWYTQRNSSLSIEQAWEFIRKNRTLLTYAEAKKAEKQSSGG